VPLKRRVAPLRARDEFIETCTILTTKPNALVANVHDRMPVILKADDYEIWLDPTVRNPALVAGCFKPFDATLMKKYPVGTRVNRPENDDPECAREIAVALPKLCSDPVHLRIGLIELEFLK
jgi:putative SOS response-associated peptidase YedK